MKRRQTCFAALLLAVLCVSGTVTALPINNRVNPDGTPVLIPAVRKFEAGKGALALPAEISVSAPEIAANEVEVFTSIVKRYFPQLKVRRSADRGFLRLELTEQDVPKSPEGYTVAIGEGIVIRSRDARGLYYGVRTVGNLLRNAVKPEVPRCRIIDWPEMPVRGLFLNVRRQGFKGSLPEMLSEIDTIGALKYNHVMLEFGEAFPYSDNPFTNRQYAFSREDVEAIRAAAKRNHIEIIPMLQIVSHDEWLHAHPKYLAEIAEGKPRGWSCATCPESELGREVQLMAIREQLDFFKPKYFNLSMDEVTNYAGWGECKRCKASGKSPKQHWEEVTKLYTGEVLKHGVTPILFHDMYYTGSRVHGDEMLPTLDKRVIFCNWDYGVKLRKSRFPFFKKAGFRLFTMSYCLRMDNMRVLPLETVKQGCGGVFLSFWGEFRYPSKPGWVSGRGLAGFTLGGFYEWNPNQPSQTALTFDPSWETLRMILPQNCPEAPASTRFTALPLDKAFNAKLGRDRRFPKSDAKIAAQMKREAAQAAEKFHIATSEDGGYFAALVGGSADAPKSVTIPVNAKAAWLGFMAVAGTVDTTLGGRPLGAMLTVRYADKTVEKIPLHYRKELPFWNYDGGAYGVRFISRFNDSRGALVSLYAQNWRNPHPEKTIAGIVMNAPAKSQIPAALFALSLGNAEKAAAKPDDAAVAGRLSAWSDPAAYQPVNAKTPGSVVLSDFSGGKLRRAKVSLSGISPDKALGASVLKSNSATSQSCFNGKLRYAIVKDPTSPLGGEVLKLWLPSLKPEYSSLSCRLVVDMSFDRAKAGDIKTFFFDFKLSHPWYNEWPGVYLMNSKPFAEAHYLGYLEGRRDSSWHHLAVPYRLFKQGKDPLNLATVDTIRFSFFLRELSEPSEICIGPAGVSSVETGLTTPLQAEKVPEKPGEKVGDISYID